MTQSYTLREVMDTLELSVEELSRLANISTAAIHRALSDTDTQQTNESVAHALCKAMGVSVGEVRWPRGLTNLGRPPHTGVKITKKITRTTVTEEISITIEGYPKCTSCNIELPLSMQCDGCT